MEMAPFFRSILRSQRKGSTVEKNRIEVMWVDIDDLPIILTPKEVGEVLGVSRNTVYEILHSKEFPAFMVGKQYRIPKKKFIDWLDSQSIA